MKEFMYFESTEGGINCYRVYSEKDLRILYGWMDMDCKERDESLLKWMEIAQIGTIYEHRLGVLVRLKDV